MTELRDIECITGPLSAEQRAILRFGGRKPFERARARAIIRSLTRACMSALDPAAFRSFYEAQKAWRDYLLVCAD